MHDKFFVEVVYANRSQCKRIALEVQEGTTIEQVIWQSGILQLFAEIQLYSTLICERNSVGIFGKIKELNTLVKPDDRVEIYRRLHLSAMDLRKNRVKKQQTKLKQSRIKDR